MDYATAEFGPLQAAKSARDAAFFKDCRRVVDLGCGPGHFLSLLQAQGTPCYGVDLASSAKAATASRGPKILRMGALEHVRRLKAGRVDGIHCSNLLEHLSVPEARELVEQCAGRIAGRGKLLLSTSNAACLGVVAGAFWDDDQHVRPYTARLLRAWAEAAGLEVLSCGPDEYSRPQGMARSLLRTLRRLAVGPFFEAPELLLLARKR
jgi:2-polyprenyl-3-methyl-5-hydroxy-6-metoxy-1,4-benzoquinol methylase